MNIYIGIAIQELTSISSHQTVLKAKAYFELFGKSTHSIHLLHKSRRSRVVVDMSDITFVTQLKVYAILNYNYAVNTVSATH